MTDTVRPIRTDGDYQAALTLAASLIDAPIGSAQSDTLAMLSILIANYERGLRQAADPLETLLLEIKIKGRSQSDLADVLGPRSRASEVLAGRRSLGGTMADKFSSAWSVPRALLGPVTAKPSIANRLGKGIAAGLVAIVVLSGATWAWAIHELPDVAPLVAQISTQPACIPLAAIPMQVRQAFLAAEDSDF